jgi:hypothetical protein
MQPRVILLDFLRRRAEVIDDAAAKEKVLRSSALPREVSTTVGPVRREPAKFGETCAEIARR